MRIISQNGITEIPYDLYGVRQLKSDLSKIIAFTNGDEFLIMAEYSTETKAQKAMEMLRAAYTGTPLIFENCDVADEVFEGLKRRSIEAILTVTNDKPKVDYLDNFYFQFPADEDVEE